MFVNGSFKKYLSIFFFLLLMISLMIFSKWLAIETSVNSLSNQLMERLPEKIKSAEINSMGDSTLMHLLAKNINKDLESINTRGFLINNCQATVIELNNVSLIDNTEGNNIIALNWLSNYKEHSAKFNVSCSLDNPRLIASQLVLALCGLFLLQIFPKQITNEHKQMIDILKQSGTSHLQALNLTRNFQNPSQIQIELARILLIQQALNAKEIIPWLSNNFVSDFNEETLEWFSLALKLKPEALDYALNIALAEPELKFISARHVVVIHGIEITLPSTLFVYYYWYAKRRADKLDDEGWFINPASISSDLNNSYFILQLLKEFKGHKKAITNLEEKGLTAKTLDQNRSKIRDEIIDNLGENLAIPYLFETQRDIRTARYKYRLSINPSLISFPKN